VPSPRSSPQLWTADTRSSIEEVGRRLDVYGSLQATMTQLSGGVFLTAYALALAADAYVIAVLAALPLAAKLTQLFTSAIIDRAGNWPRTAIGSATVARLLLLVAAAIPIMYDAGPEAARMLVLVVALSSFAASFFDLALLTWMAELVPVSMRGRFLGARNKISGVVGQVTALAAAVVLEWLSRESGPSPMLYGGIFAVSAVIGLGALPVLARVPPPRRSHSRADPPPLRHMLTAPLADANFRTFLGFAVPWHVALGMTGPFLLVFMLDELKLSLLTVTALTGLTSTTAALTMAYWGRLGDHFGSKTVIRAGTYLITIPTILWLVVTPDRWWPVILIQVVSGLGWGAYNSNVNNFVLKVAPERRGPSYIATLGAVAGGAEAVGPLVGGAVLSVAAGWSSSTLVPYYLLVMIGFLLRAVATTVPGHVHEPGGVAVGRMVRTMARFRSMSADEAFSPLFTHVYTHVARLADFIAREPALAKRGSSS
jgi:MFS family permease